MKSWLITVKSVQLPSNDIALQVLLMPKFADIRYNPK